MMERGSGDPDKWRGLKGLSRIEKDSRVASNPKSEMGHGLYGFSAWIRNNWKSNPRKPELRESSSL
jgi:hypothetical protein